LETETTKPANCLPDTSLNSAGQSWASYSMVTACCRD